MELKQIKYFIEVAKQEHVTRAADTLHVAQSAVSRQIFNLEAELGVDLFIREGRNVRLTSIGKVFLDRMENAIHVIDDVSQIIEEYTDPEMGTIHIGFPSSVASYILPTAISAFRERYPNVKFKLNQESYYELKQAVIKGEINMALLGPVPVKEKKLEGTILFSENMAALLPASHPLAGSDSLHLNELRDDSFVLFPENFVLRNITIDACRQLGFEPNVSFEGKDIDAIKGLVSAGLGVSLIPEITLVDNLPRATVKMPITTPNVTRTVGVIVPSDRQLLPTEKLFYQFLKEFFVRLEQFQS
ncbi:LysR family transcriptional regulator [Virgibacillus sp. NKC19-16]|uniref:LysR family transcriptional regulator n=1 Tax=Virgibacillus salidurans TaxID=2831673 RepID=UPI001F307203|nr:LysR family transcriptional regulator [Virgibacillus sp. NKC19-16]UJL46210.1 LysR family transcriptional regulator [Virgibacillus sp. NKC19-16]